MVGATPHVGDREYGGQGDRQGRGPGTLSLRTPLTAFQNHAELGCTWHLYQRSMCLKLRDLRNHLRN